MAKKLLKKAKIFIHIEELKPNRRKEFNEMVKAGKDAPYMAKVMFRDWKVAQDSNETSIRRGIDRYLDTHIKGKFKINEKNLDKETRKLVLAAINPDYNSLSELQELAEMQKERLIEARDREREMPVPMSWLVKDIVAYKDTLISVAQLQLKMGYLKGQDGQYVSPYDVGGPEQLTDDSSKIFGQIEKSTHMVVSFLKELSTEPKQIPIDVESK